LKKSAVILGGCLLAGATFMKRILVQEKALVKGVSQEARLSTAQGKVILQEGKAVAPASKISKTERFINIADKVSTVFDLIPDDTYMSSTMKACIDEVLSPANKKNLLNDFSKIANQSSVTWSQVQNYFRSPAEETGITVSAEFRHKMLLKYSDTYLNEFGVLVLQDEKCKEEWVNSLKKIAIHRKLSPDSKLMIAINENRNGSLMDTLRPVKIKR
jgi:hypothetical protein